MTLILRSAAATDLGMVRANNEDSAYAGRRLAVVADGIGGAPAGEAARDIVIKAVSPLDTVPTLDDPALQLRSALTEANQRILKAIEEHPAHEGMGTTVTMLLLHDSTAIMLHVGDSRGYLLRGPQLHQITKDDTLVQSLVDQGLLEQSEARHHPQRSIITQAVQGLDIDPARYVFDVEIGDRFLLCSDGLSDIITDDTICRTLLTYTEPPECAEQLIRLALRAGAPDNVTVVIADVVQA
jgi:PPM family protein phosphatase